MKVKTTGKIPTEEKNKKCYNCKSVLTYSPKDIEQDRDGRYIVCPTCGKFIAV